MVSHREQQNSAAVTTADFVPRIRVIKEDCFTTATVCHQCEDAPCANVCPVQAIRRDRGHIFVTPSRCIGCKSCMLACPFGAMTVVASASGAQAIKCDLCWHREAGPACVKPARPVRYSALTQHTCSASASILNLSERRSGLHDGRNNRQPSRRAFYLFCQNFYARLDFVRFRHVVHPHTLCVCGRGLSSPGKK